MNLAQFFVINLSQGGRVFKVAEPSKDGDGRQERQRIEEILTEESIQHRRCPTSFLEHEVGRDQFRRRPSHHRQHGETGVTQLGLLQRVQVKVLREAKRVKARVAGVGPIQGGGTFQEGQGEAGLLARVAAPLFECKSVGDGKCDDGPMLPDVTVGTVNAIVDPAGKVVVETMIHRTTLSIVVDGAQGNKHSRASRGRSILAKVQAVHPSAGISGDKADTSQFAGTEKEDSISSWKGTATVVVWFGN
jgi:hypothetical protein